MQHVSWRVTAEDFRGLRKIDWSPSGLCLLSGPNGSGKTTILGALAFLRAALDRGVQEAARAMGGGAFLRRVGADAKAPVRLSISVGEVAWEIVLPIEGGAVHPFHGETLRNGTEEIARRDTYSSHILVDGRRGATNLWFNPGPRAVVVRYADIAPLNVGPGSVELPRAFDGSMHGLVRGERWNAEPRSLPRMVWDKRPHEALPADLGALIALVEGIQVHAAYHLGAMGGPQSGVGVEARLLPDGTNAWNVLRNWKSAPRKHQDRFEWVLDALRDAFPDLATDLEFETQGQSVFGSFYPRGSQAGIPLDLAADGLLVGILHLAAVAGAPEGSVLAFDEVETHLHPHAIRPILRSMRKRADERDLTIIVTTHSPFVMNEFKGREDDVYVLEPGREPLPVRLTEALDPDWIAHFSLGDLYDREEFAAQKAGFRPPHAAE